MQQIQDRELRELAATLPEVVLRGKAPATVKMYKGAFVRWKKWAPKKKEVCVFPGSAFHGII